MNASTTSNNIGGVRLSNGDIIAPGNVDISGGFFNPTATQNTIGGVTLCNTIINADGSYFYKNVSTIFSNSHGNGWIFSNSGGSNVCQITAAGALTAVSFTGNGSGLTNVAAATAVKLYETWTAGSTTSLLSDGGQATVLVGLAA